MGGKERKKRVKKPQYILIIGAVIIAVTAAQILGGLTIQTGVFILGLILGIAIGLRR